MESNTVIRSKTVIEQPVICGHEILLFEGDYPWNAIKGWILNQYLNTKATLVFDDTVSNISRLESFLPSSDDEFYQKSIRHSSFNEFLPLIYQNRFEKIREILRDQIWKAIDQDSILGVSYLFNFDGYIQAHKAAVLNFENILNDIFQNKFGFPIDCCCLYPSSIDVLDFAELVDLHNGYQIFDKFQKSRLRHQSNANHIVTEKNREIKRTKYSKKLDDSLTQIANRALSVNNSPFFFYKGHQIISTAYHLEEFYQELKQAPLDVFCFHCYRTSRSNLAGISTSPSPRSDIALWIEYSIGDTELAHQIFNSVTQSLGDRINTLESASKFTQLIIKSAVLELIRSRLDYFSNKRF